MTQTFDLDDLKEFIDDYRSYLIARGLLPRPMDKSTMYLACEGIIRPFDKGEPCTIGSLEHEVNRGLNNTIYEQRAEERISSANKNLYCQLRTLYNAVRSKYNLPRQRDV